MGGGEGAIVVIYKNALLIAVVAVGLSVSIGPATADESPPLSPDEAVRRMVLPPGFRATVFAAEPDVRQPVAACFDERGRLWVIEYLQYPTPAGLVPLAADQYLRTEYDRAAMPPPLGPRGADRIKVFEDTDGDGRADKSTTFAEGLNLASGLAVGRGGVFVAQAPYLLFFPDADRDDRPDGPPRALLAGFGTEDAHAVVNSLAWGPDGWLYGAQGSTVTARVRGVEFQQGIWRYHVPTRRFELFAEGGGNTWGLDFDRRGRALGSSNGGFVAFHMVPGGHYWKGFAKHGPLHNPRAYGYFDALRYDGPKQGGHVTPGGIVYKGAAFSAEFDGAFLGGNLLANSAYWHHLSEDGSTLSARHGGTLIDARDPWFRPIDLVTGPDGALYVCDWYDRRASHLDPRDNWHKSSGRIYKITYGDPRPTPRFDLAGSTTADLIALRDKPNDWWPETARRLLYERGDRSAVPSMRAALEADRDPATALRDLWALHACGGLDDRAARELLDHPVGDVRAWVTRLLADDHRMNSNLCDRLVSMAADDPDVGVRSALASACQRWETADALPILAALLGRVEDRADRFVPLQLWWAAEHHLRRDRDAVIARLADPAIHRGELARSAILGRAARAMTESSTAGDLEAAGRLVAATAGDPPAFAAVLAGLDQGLAGRVLPAGSKPPGLLAALKGGPESADRLRVAARLGDRGSLATILEQVASAATAEAERIRLIELIGQARDRSTAPVLIGLVTGDAGLPLRRAALDALALDDRDAVAADLLTRFPDLPPALRAAAIDHLVARPSWAARLLEALGDGRIAAAGVTVGQARRIAAHGDSGLDEGLERAWGRLPTAAATDAAKAARIAAIRGILPEGDKGRADRGRTVFDRVCAACHRRDGTGEAIGPDLTGVDRDLEFLLQSLVDPSAILRKEYQSQVFGLDDGRVLDGLVVEETGAAVVVVDAQRRKHVIPRDAIEDRGPSPASLMPEGLLDPLPDPEIRDLFRFLLAPPAAPPPG